MDIEHLYRELIRPLSTAEQLRLARLILNEIRAAEGSEFSDEWSDEDLQDLTRASLARWLVE